MNKLRLLSIFILLSFSYSLLAEDLTFFVTSDPHYGYDMWTDNEKINKSAIDDMNALPGKKYPEIIGGTVAAPNGVLVPGDLTSDGSGTCWNGYWYLPWTDGFNDDYDVNGNGRLRYPIYEGYGNHDIHNRETKPVLEGIKLRNQARANPIYTDKGGLHYSWDWEGIHFINLNIYPGGEGDARNSLEFLREDLAERVGDSGQPVILMFHYDIYTGPSWWTKMEQQVFYDVIKNHNIIAIITGHTHVSRYYVWNSIPVFNAPTVKTNGTYHVFNINDGGIIVTERSPKGWGTTWQRRYLSAGEFLEKRQYNLSVQFEYTD